MFKLGGFEQELASSMQEQLVSNQLDNKFNFDRIAKAIDLLHSAAEIFDDTGFHVEAEVITRVLEKIASKQDPAEKKSSKTAAISLGDLTHDEMRFYQELPRHTKDLLEKNIKQHEYFIDPSDFVKEVKLLYKIRKAQEPEVLEFESLMHEPKEEIDPYGETVDITSLTGKKKV